MYHIGGIDISPQPRARFWRLTNVLYFIWMCFIVGPALMLAAVMSGLVGRDGISRNS